MERAASKSGSWGATQRSTAACREVPRNSRVRLAADVSNRRGDTLRVDLVCGPHEDSEIPISEPPGSPQTQLSRDARALDIYPFVGGVPVYDHSVAERHAIQLAKCIVRRLGLRARSMHSPRIRVRPLRDQLSVRKHGLVALSMLSRQFHERADQNGSGSVATVGRRGGQRERDEAAHQLCLKRTRCRAKRRPDPSLRSSRSELCRDRLHELGGDERRHPGSQHTTDRRRSLTFSLPARASTRRAG